MWYWHERSGHCTWQPPTDDTIIPEVQLSPADQVHVNGRRSLVVDINNVGHRYGARFLAARKVLSSRQGLFDWHGVRLCVRNLNGLHLLYARALEPGTTSTIYGFQFSEFSGNDSGEGLRERLKHVHSVPTDIVSMMQVLCIDRDTDESFRRLGYAADDYQMILQAFRLNCPIVSVDGMEDWLSGSLADALPSEVARWLQETVEAHREWTFHVSDSGQVIIGGRVRPAACDDLDGLSKDTLASELKQLHSEMVLVNARGR